jgi:hypothetical protein
MHQHIARPAVFERSGCIPKPLGFVWAFLEEGDVVVPGNLVKRRLTNWKLWVCFRKLPHIFQIGGGKTFQLGKFGF